MNVSVVAPNGSTMKAMVLDRTRAPLRLAQVPRPHPRAHQVLVRVRACAVCRTDLHVLDGELPRPKLPLILGHEIVGVVVERGEGVQSLAVGDRIGVPWLGSACGVCAYCRTGRENLCDRAQFTGYELDGGYAELAVADARYCFRIPDVYGDTEAAPLLCAGLIGHRALSMTSHGRKLGLYGFGASAHLVAQMAEAQGREVYAFTRDRDGEAQTFAYELGAVWAGGSSERPPTDLDAAIIFAPNGDLVPRALRAVGKGGVVVCAGIHMSDIPSFPYELLWGERVLRSVANLTRRDGEEFFAETAQKPVHATVRSFSLEQANEALSELRAGHVTGAAVLDVSPNAIAS
jgi:propanol-preferring alcohol dehydrogenase